MRNYLKLTKYNNKKYDSSILVLCNALPGRQMFQVDSYYIPGNMQRAKLERMDSPVGWMTNWLQYKCFVGA